MIKYSIFIFLLLSYNINVYGNNNEFSLMDAVKLSLNNNYDIKIQKKVLNQYKQQNILQQGVYDYILGSSVSLSKSGIALTDYQKGLYYTNYSSLYDKIYQETQEYSIYLQKKIRFGTNFLLKGSYIKTDNLTNPSNAGNPEYYEKISLNVEQPLLKNVGKNKANINEIVSEIMYNKNKLEFKQTISYQINKVVQAYWNYIYATKNLNILKSAESKYYELVEKIKILIKNGERPAAELDQLNADLSVKKSYIISGEQLLYETKSALAVILGTDINNIDFPTENFFKIENIKLKNLNSYIDIALKNRNEIKAIDIQIKSTELIMKKSKTDLRPDLNLLVAGEINNPTTGSEYSYPFTDDEKGWKLSGSINLSLPIQNKQNKSIYKKNVNEYEKLILQKQDLIQKIKSNVSIAYHNLKNSLNSLKHIINSVNEYEKAVKNIKKKYDLGMATIIDVTVTEDKLTNALQNKISAYNKTVKAVSQLNYETGNIVKFNDNNFEIKKLNLIKIN